MNIEVGKRYRTRSGAVVEIVARDAANLKCKAADVKTFPKEWWPVYWTYPNGCFLPSKDHPLDLIEELPAYDEHGLTADDYYTGISYPNG